MEKETLLRILKTQNSDLKTGEIEGMLRYLSENTSIENNDLVRFTGIPKETLKAFKKSLAEYLEPSIGDRIKLKPQYREIFRGMGLRKFERTLLHSENPDLLKKFTLSKEKHTRVPERDYDQFYATDESVIAKAIILNRKGLLENRRLALLGDDDLLSVALGQGDFGVKEVVVFDVDEKVLKTISDVCAKSGISSVHTVRYDCRKDLEQKYSGYFDVAVTDPPYTKFGVALFLNRALDLVGKTTSYDGKYIVLYFGNSFKTPEKTLSVQNLILARKVIIEDRLDKYVQYHGAESIGSASSVYILKTTPFSAPVHNNILIDNIYTYQEQKEDRFPFVEHYTFKLFGVPEVLLRSKANLIKSAEEFCKAHKITVVDKIVTDFKGGGISLTFILASSNMLLHSWPENSALHVDLLTCKPIGNCEKLSESIKRLFKPSSFEINRIE